MGTGARRLPQGLDRPGAVQLPEFESLGFGERRGGRAGHPWNSRVEAQPPLWEGLRSVRLEQEERAVLRECSGVGLCPSSPFDRGERRQEGHLFFDPGERLLESGSSQVGCVFTAFLQALPGQCRILAHQLPTQPEHGSYEHDGNRQ